MKITISTDNNDVINQTRRQVLRVSVAAISLGIINSACSTKAIQTTKQSLPELLPPDQNGIRLLPGFTSRIIANSNRPVGQTSFDWHSAPDGGAVFPTKAGWIYVSNSEKNQFKGSVRAIRFDNTGKIIDAYSLLEGSNRNCAGGATPWNTWLSCEEYGRGMVWECDPYGKRAAISHPELGVFSHEAVAVDPIRQQIYLTEDKKKGGFYRFSHYSVKNNQQLDLSTGQLEIAEVFTDTSDASKRKIKWHKIPDPQALRRSLRKQVAQSTAFKGGEGAVFHDNAIIFSTKKDNKIWRYNIPENNISVIYDDDNFQQPILRGVDNIAITPHGNIIVAEDGDDQQIVLLTPDKKIYPVMQLIGHHKSEITGPAFSPDGSRLYFSSQRGKTGKSRNGITYEIKGPLL